MKESARICLLFVFLGVAVTAQSAESSTSDAEASNPVGKSENGGNSGLESTGTFPPSQDLRHDLHIENGKTQSELSTLWTAVVLNMIAADVLSLFIPESMNDFRDFANGKEADLMLAGAIFYQIPISMVYLSKVLPYGVNRWTNIITAGLVSVAIIAGGSTDPHYMVFAGAEVIGLSLISWKAWKWNNHKDKKTEKGHGLSLDLNHPRQAYGVSYTYKF